MKSEAIVEKPEIWATAEVAFLEVPFHQRPKITERLRTFNHETYYIALGVLEHWATQTAEPGRQEAAAFFLHRIAQVVDQMEDEGRRGYCRQLFQRLQAVKVHKQWRWKQVAAWLGVSVPMLMMVKSGQRGFSKNTLHRLATLEREIKEEGGAR